MDGHHGDQGCHQASLGCQSWRKIDNLEKLDKILGLQGKNVQDKLFHTQFELHIIINLTFNSVLIFFIPTLAALQEKYFT